MGSVQVGAATGENQFPKACWSEPGNNEGDGERVGVGSVGLATGAFAGVAVGSEIWEPNGSYPGMFGAGNTNGIKGVSSRQFRTNSETMSTYVYPMDP